MTADDLTSSRGLSLLGMARRAAQTLRTSEWSVREAAMLEGAVVDLVAMRRWEQKAISADVRLLIHCDAGQDRVLASSTESVAESLPAFCFVERFGDDTLGSRARIAPPPLRAKGSLFHADDPTAIELAFVAVDAMWRALGEHETEVAADDLADPAESNPHVTLIHSIVLTDAPIQVLGDNDRTRTQSAVRLIRTAAASGERTWIDVVNADGFESYVESITRYYAGAMKKRRFA